MADRIVLNTISYHGHGAIENIVPELTARGYKKAFVCSDPDLIKFGVTKKVTDLLDAANFAYAVYSEIMRMPPREEFTFFGLSESLEMSAMRPMGHRPKANSAAIKIQPPTSTSFFFFVFPPLSSKRNEPVSGSYSKSLLIYLFSFFLPALAARSRSKSTIFVFLPVFSSST